jgi:hypothetical protein
VCVCVFRCVCVCVCRCGQRGQSNVVTNVRACVGDVQRGKANIKLAGYWLG